MCRSATIRVVTFAGLLAVAGWYAQAQQPGIGWRRIGTSAIEVGLPGLATGPVDRVWYAEDGSLLYARTASGRIFQTLDFEQWRPVADPKIAPPAQRFAPSYGSPEPLFKLANQPASSSRVYGIGQNAYRSDDGGQSWSNLTAYQGRCILGGGLMAMAVSPRDSDEVVVASNWGVWRSADGGLSWFGLNDFLPNLPAQRFLALPSGARGLRMSVGAGGNEIEWAPGEKTAWRPADVVDAQQEQNVKAALSQVLGSSVTAVATAKDYIYAGDSDGRLRVSSDAGTTWGVPFRLGDSGRVEAIWVDANDPRVALAALSARSGTTAAKPAYVLRTMNGGGFWDDITANLPDNAAAHGIAADRPSGAIYVATDAGVFYTFTDLGAAGRATPWASLAQGLPSGPATDVKLDTGGNQLYVSLEGYGVYTTIAPHRLRDPRVVNAADYSSRPAAPGSLLSVLGARVQSARSADTTVPVLDASDAASQIQVPFEAKGSTVTLSLEAAGAGALTFGLPLKSVSPAIFVDPEGTPLIMDASSGVLLDAGKPAHAGARLQILATGLGRVKPDWPTGLAAPLADPPHVAATVRAYLDGSPIDVTEATLAPGYVGFYLIEIQLPRITNTGPVELYLEAEGQQSNRVRLYIQP